MIGLINFSIFYFLVVNHIGNHNNYKLSNISISNIILVVYIFFPLLIVFHDMASLLIDIYAFPSASTGTVVLPEDISNYYTFFTYENISFPTGLFTEEVQLD